MRYSLVALALFVFSVVIYNSIGADTPERETDEVAIINAETLAPSGVEHDNDRNFNREPSVKDDCENLWTKKNELNKLEESNKRFVGNYYKDLVSQGFTFEQLDVLSEKIDEATSLYYSYEPSLSADISIGDLYAGKRFASLKETHMVNEIIANQNYGAIRKLLGDDVDNSLYGGLTVHALISNMAEEPILDVFAILQSQNIKPSLLDIINAIKNQKTQEAIKYLIRQVETNKEVFWKQNEKLQSVSKLLISRYYGELLSIWLSKIEFETVDKDLKVLLDDFPTPSSRDLSDALGTLSTLIDFGARVKSQYGYSKIKSWAPKPWFDDNHKFLNYIERKLDKGLNPGLKIIVDKLEPIILKKQVVEGLIVSCEKNNTINANNIDRMYKKHADKIADFKMPLGLRGLAQMKIAAPLLSIRMQLIDAVVRRDWLLAQEKINLLLNTGIKEIALDSVLEAALRKNAPIEFFVSLIDLGAKLPNTAVHTLARSGYLNLIRQLRNYGLNINARNSMGINAVSWVIFADSYDPKENRSKTLAFLLENDVSDKNLDGEFDALNYALMMAKKNEMSILYAKTLLQYGASINNSHRQQVLRIKRNSQGLYAKLVNELPEFEVFSHD